MIQHELPREAVGPRTAIVAVVRHAPKIQRHALCNRASLVRKFDPHHHRRVQFDGSDVPQIHSFGEPRGPDERGSVLLKKACADAWNHDEDRERQAKGTDGDSVDRPKEVARERLPRRARILRDEVSGMLVQFIAQMIQQERPNRDEQIREEHAAVPDVSRQRRGGEHSQQTDRVEMQKVFFLMQVQQLVDHQHDQEVHRRRKDVAREQQQIQHKRHERRDQENVPRSGRQTAQTRHPYTGPDDPERADDDRGRAEHDQPHRQFPGEDQREESHGRQQDRTQTIRAFEVHAPS